MSKIGKKPIPLGNVVVEVIGQEIKYKGPQASGVYTIPRLLSIEVVDKNLMLTPQDSRISKRNINRLWGLHRALLFNHLRGAEKEFERHIEINGLGYKARLDGAKIEFSLGYSHKIDYVIPEKVAVSVDKSGQKLLIKSSDKELLGHVCSVIRSFRPPEPYKGKGIRFAGEEIIRKAGKTKS